MTKPVLVLGAGGHAKVLIEALIQSGTVVAGIADSDSALVGTNVLGIPILGGDEIVGKFSPAETLLVNGIGSVGLSIIRQQIFIRFKEIGYNFATVIHPSAVIASDVVLGEGTQVMAGAIIQPGCCIGNNTIINTRTSVDHDCMIGAHVHIAPGVTLSGGVTIGEASHIGTGAIIIQGIIIGRQSVVGAGSLLLKDVCSLDTVVGVPAKVLIR